MMRTLSPMLLLLALLSPLTAQAAIDVETTRLGHGVRGWYAENDTVPVVHVILTFEGAGSVSDSLGKNGRAALAANMLTEGAGSYDAVGFQRALEDKAISIDVAASADRLTVQLHCLRQDAARAGQLLALALTQPNFTEADLARVRAQTISYLLRLDENPTYHASRSFDQKAFAGHPYASPLYGTPTSLKAIAPQDLRDYLATYVTRGNMLVTAAGDVDGALLGDMLAPSIKALPPGDSGPVPVTRIAMQGSGQSVVDTLAVPQSTVLFAAPGVARNDDNFYAFYLLNEILGGNALTSRLADGVRQQKGLVYSINSGIEERSGTSLLRGVLATRAGQEDEAIARVKSILSDMQTRGVTTQECEDARTHVLGAFPLQLDSSRSVASTLMMMRMFDLGPDYLKTRTEKFEAVRCADVNALAREYLAPSRFLFVTVGEGNAP